METVQIKKEEKIVETKNGVKVLQNRYFYDASYDTASVCDKANRLVDFFPFSEAAQKALAAHTAQAGTAHEQAADPAHTAGSSDTAACCGGLGRTSEISSNAADAAIMGTGWQSWSPGWELLPGESYPKYKSFLIPSLKKNITMPGTIEQHGILLAQFITYFRFGSEYIVMASTGSAPHNPDGSARAADYPSCMPPVQFRIDREFNMIAVEIYAQGKTWKDGDITAEICIFRASSYGEMCGTIRALYRDSRFDNLAFLDPSAHEEKRPFMPGGWESWYNHYNKINEKLILADLDALASTENIIKKLYIDKKRPVIFQIDDGWQQGLGQWEINSERFPRGLRDVTIDIEAKGYIPGLWIAPFIIDIRTKFAQQHQDWILRDTDGKPVAAGFNAPWGSPPHHNYFCLDLSRDDVLEHVSRLTERAIEEWGFRYLKLDFLFAGMLEGVRKNGGAAYGWYDRAVRALTNINVNSRGQNVAYLGCGMPFESSFRCLPLSRIGADTLEKWDRTDLKILSYGGRPSAYISMKDTLGHAFWNEAVFLNDPDVSFFRSVNTTLTYEEKKLVALVNLMFAGQLMISDDVHVFDTELDAPLVRDVEETYSALLAAGADQADSATAVANQSERTNAAVRADQADLSAPGAAAAVSGVPFNLVQIARDVFAVSRRGASYGADQSNPGAARTAPAADQADNPAQRTVIINLSEKPYTAHGPVDIICAPHTISVTTAPWSSFNE